MSLNRTTILTGPAIVLYGGQTFWSKGDVTVKPTNKRNAIQTASFGKVDERFTDKSIEVSFEPDGRFTSALAAVLWPYAAMPIGTSIYGSADHALEIWSRDGKHLTLPNAAVTGMPNISLSVGKTIQGSIKFTGLLANSTDPTAAGAYYILATGSYPGDTGFAVSDILTRAYTSAWGNAGAWASFATEAGWEISFGLKLAPQVVDGLGTVDMRLESLDVTAKAIPVGPSESDIMGLLSGTQALGSSIAANANPLVISATGVYAKVYNASLVDAQLVYGAQKKRLQACDWIATRTITGGTPDPLFYIGTTAPA